MEKYSFEWLKIRSYYKKETLFLSKNTIEIAFRQKKKYIIKVHDNI